MSDSKKIEQCRNAFLRALANVAAIEEGAPQFSMLQKDWIRVGNKAERNLLGVKMSERALFHEACSRCSMSGEISSWSATAREAHICKRTMSRALDVLKKRGLVIVNPPPIGGGWVRTEKVIELAGIEPSEMQMQPCRQNGTILVTFCPHSNKVNTLTTTEGVDEKTFLLEAALRRFLEVYPKPGYAKREVAIEAGLRCAKTHNLSAEDIDSITSAMVQDYARERWPNWDEFWSYEWKAFLPADRAAELGLGHRVKIAQQNVMVKSLTEIA